MEAFEQAIQRVIRDDGTVVADAQDDLVAVAAANDKPCQTRILGGVNNGEDSRSGDGGMFAVGVKSNPG